MPRYHFFLATSLVLGALAGVSPRAAAQRNAQVAVSGGVATDQAGARSNALTIAPSLFAGTDNAGFRLGATATWFANEAWSAGLTGALQSRTGLGRFLALTLDGTAGASRFTGTSRATFLEGAVTPALEASVGRVTLFGGVRAATGMIRQDASRPLPLGPTPRTNETTVSGGGPLYGAVLTLLDGPRGGVRLTAREDRLRVSGEDITDRAVGVAGRYERTQFGISAGFRESRGLRASFGSGVISVPIGTGGNSLDLAAGRYVANPFTGTPAGSFASLGITLRASTGADRGPDIRGVPPVQTGLTRLAIRAPDARVVDVAGDFNDWRPTRAMRAAGGMWYADLRIPPGNYRYAFRVDGSEWRVPDGATAVDDGFGGKSAWLSVDESGPRR